MQAKQSLAKQSLAEQSLSIAKLPDHQLTEKSSGLRQGRLFLDGQTESDR